MTLYVSMLVAALFAPLHAAQEALDETLSRELPEVAARDWEATSFELHSDHVCVEIEAVGRDRYSIQFVWVDGSIAVFAVYKEGEAPSNWQWGRSSQ